MLEIECVHLHTATVIKQTRLRITTNIGALIIRIGFWGPLYYSYNKKPPK